MATVTKETSQTLKRKTEEDDTVEVSCDEEASLLSSKKYKPIIMERKGINRIEPLLSRNSLNTKDEIC